MPQCGNFVVQVNEFYTGVVCNVSSCLNYVLGTGEVGVLCLKNIQKLCKRRDEKTESLAPQLGDGTLEPCIKAM